MALLAHRVRIVADSQILVTMLGVVLVVAGGTLDVPIVVQMASHRASSLRTEAAPRDGNTWHDDSVEVFINPEMTEAPYIQFIINAAGAFFDQWSRTGAESYAERLAHNFDCDWAARVEILKGIDTYFDLLGRSEPDIQLAAIGLLLSCKESLTEIVDRLSQINAKELDDRVHAFLLLGTSIAAPERTDLFSDLARSRTAAPILRIAAILAYWYQNQELPVDKQNILVRAVKKDPSALLELDRLVRKNILGAMERPAGDSATG